MAENQGVTGEPVGASLVPPNSPGAIAPDTAPNGAGGDPAAPAADRGQRLSSNLAARLIMVSPERVRQLSKEGWIEKQGKDQFYLVDVVQGYIRFTRDSARRAVKSAGDNRVRDARAREIELRNALAEGRIILTDEALAIVEEIIGMTRAEFAGLPARVTRDLAFRRTIETAVNDILTRLADIGSERGLALAAIRAAGAAVTANAPRRMGGAEPDLSADGGDTGSA